MTTFKRTVFALLISASMFAITVPALAQRGNGPGCCQAAVEPVTSEEAAWLTHMREEEKLARDVYQHLYERWNVAIFSNISASEDRHFDAVGRLLPRYGIPDPAEHRLAGEYNDPTLQALYAELVAKGETSLEDALRVGVLIEEVDIDDLEVALTQTDKLNVKRVYANLLDGSFNHLEAFQTALEILVPSN